MVGMELDKDYKLSVTLLAALLAMLVLAFAVLVGCSSASSDDSGASGSSGSSVVAESSGGDESSSAESSRAGGESATSSSQDDDAGATEHASETSEGNSVAESEAVDQKRMEDAATAASLMGSFKVSALGTPLGGGAKTEAEGTLTADPDGIAIDLSTESMTMHVAGELATYGSGMVVYEVTEQKSTLTYEGKTADMPDEFKFVTLMNTGYPDVPIVAVLGSSLDEEGVIFYVFYG